MGRPRDPHPLGKCTEERIEMAIPAEMKRRLAAISTLHGKSPTGWARDVLEKAIEGEWAFMRRRIGTAGPADQPGELTEKHPDA